MLEDVHQQHQVEGPIGDGRRLEIACEHRQSAVPGSTRGGGVGLDADDLPAEGLHLRQYASAAAPNLEKTAAGRRREARGPHIDLRPPAGVQEKEAYLAQRHPGYPSPPRAAIRWMNENLPLDARVLFIAESRSHGLKRRAVPSSVYDVQPIERFSRGASSGEEVVRRLRDAGVTHLFFNHAEALRTEGYGLFRWDEPGWRAFSEFWGRYVRTEWKSEKGFFVEAGGRLLPGVKEGLYVYRIAENPGDGDAPPNPLLRWAPK